MLHQPPIMNLQEQMNANISPASSEDEFVPPPPPPPRILLLRGACLTKVYEYLDDADIKNARSSCRLLRDVDEFETVDLNTTVDERDVVTLSDDKWEDVAEVMVPPPSLSMTPTATESKTVIMAPPGKLGIRLENKPYKEGTVITLVSEGSPLEGKVFEGDVIVNVNGVNVERMDTYGKLLLSRDDPLSVRTGKYFDAYTSLPII